MSFLAVIEEDTLYQTPVKTELATNDDQADVEWKRRAPLEQKVVAADSEEVMSNTSGIDMLDSTSDEEGSMNKDENDAGVTETAGCTTPSKMNLSCFCACLAGSNENDMPSSFKNDYDRVQYIMTNTVNAVIGSVLLKCVKMLEGPLTGLIPLCPRALTIPLDCPMMMPLRIQCQLLSQKIQ
ncbi:hypothetical protein EOD39_13604 [Acipenser ruthenus]|uniref:Uncharacterized protein n=1 Tax=Acipenser ruthenus TaxID=7906 RepID=A0A662YNE4_ACIRT|nr:hypothetical protein EOD39_13604 [Acipenser ruthenus]